MLTNFQLRCCIMQQSCHPGFIQSWLLVISTLLWSQSTEFWLEPNIFIKISHDWVKTEVGQSAEYGTRGYKPERRRDIIFVRLLCTVSHFPLFCRFSASSTLCRTNQLKWEFKLRIDLLLACSLFCALPSLSLCVCVLFFLLAAGLTSCPMETHWLSFLFNGQGGQRFSQLDGAGLTVWPAAVWC